MLPILKDKRVGIEYVLKKLKGSESYDDMKHHNEYGSGEKLEMHDKPQKDYKIGMDQAVDTMMEAFSSKNVESFKKGLSSFIEMVMDQHSKDKKEM